MDKKIRFYSIVTVYVGEHQQCTYDIEDWALNAPIPTTGWCKMGEDCSHYPIKAGAEVSIYISNWNNKIEFEAHVTETHDKRLWFECDSMKENEHYRELIRFFKKELSILEDSQQQ